MREIRMLRSTWRGLETWHGRDAVTLADERARQQATRTSTYTGAPVSDPTCERLGVKFPGPTRHFASPINDLTVETQRTRTLCRPIRRLRMPRRVDLIIGILFLRALVRNVCRMVRKNAVVRMRVTSVSRGKFTGEHLPAGIAK